MAMRESELALRATGDPVDAAYADTIAEILKKRGKDVRLSSPEAPVEIKSFSAEQKKALGMRGYVIYELTGSQSLKTLKDGGRNFWTTWHNDKYDFEASSSIHSEVALNPNNLFLPYSDGKSLMQQEEMVKIFSKELNSRIPGVMAKIGEVADYAQFAFLHLDATVDKGSPVHLFGQNYGNKYARTKTKIDRIHVAHIGRFRVNDGLGIGYLNSDRGSQDVSVAPLLFAA